MVRDLREIDVASRRVLLRCDFNVSMDGGVVRDRSRLEAHKQTVEYLLAGGARVLLLSHMGRPKGEETSKSLRLLLRDLGETYGRDVKWLGDILATGVEDCAAEVSAGEIGLFENIRFHAGEELGDEDFARAVASQGDIYVNDAFSVSHRGHASVSLVPRLLPSYGGWQMIKEVQALSGALAGGGKTVAVIGGSKISTKLGVLEGLLEKVDTLAIVGAMAHTFLQLRGYELGNSLVEENMLDAARKVELQAERRGVSLLVAEDVVVACADGSIRTCDVASIRQGECALDIGAATLLLLAHEIAGADKVLWNGPLGKFEDERFKEGTSKFAKLFCEVTARGGSTLAGGGDTIAALHSSGIDIKDRREISYVSMAGGAFLEWLEGKQLPGIIALMEG